MIEVAIIASDIQEVLGSAIGFNLLSNGAIPLYAGVLITAADTFTFLFLESYGLRKLEAFFATLIAVMVGTFGYMFYSGGVDQVGVIEGVIIPRSNSGIILQSVGMVGAVIMPHNLYLHSALVLSRNVDQKNRTKIRDSILYSNMESGIALFVSFLINLFVMGVFAQIFNNPLPQYADVCSADDIDLRNAGTCLQAVYGQSVIYIWAIGLLAAGQSSTMTGTYAGQFVMDGFLKLKLPPWKRVLMTRSIAIIPAILVAVVAHGGENTINTLGEWLNVLQSFQLPFALLPVIHFTSNPEIVGYFAIGRWTKILGWVAIFAILGINAYLIYSQVSEYLSYWYFDIVLCLVIIAYSIFVLRLGLGPYFKRFRYNKHRQFEHLSPLQPMS